jgi:hypothetical protein
MSDFGCVYKPRPQPGRCIKDIHNTTVDTGCEKINDSCKLKTTPDVFNKEFNPEGFRLTGIKDVDYGILNLLPDKDLVTLCDVDSNAAKYCWNQDYWANRVQYLFPYVPFHVLDEGRNGRKWSDYYIQDLRSTDYYEMQIRGVANNRTDLQMISIRNGAILDKNIIMSMAENAAANGNVEMLQDIKQIGLDLHQNNGELMEIAARNGNYWVVKYLIDDGADVRGYAGFRALLSATRALHYNIRDLLKQYGATTNPPVANVRLENGQINFV